MTIKDRSAAVLGLIMILLGAAILVSARQIQSGFSYDAVGPSVFPTIIGCGFIVSAILILVDSVRVDPDEDAPVLDWWPVAFISGAILLEAFFVATFGWVPMAATVFAAGAWAMGERRLLLTAALGVVLAGLILLAFNWGLGLELPLGILAPIFPDNS